MDNKSTYGDMGRKAKSAIKESQDTVSEYYDDAVDKTSEWYESGKDQVLNFVEEKPLTALLVAGGVGFALSLLMSASKSNSHRK